MTCVRSVLLALVASMTFVLSCPAGAAPDCSRSPGDLADPSLPAGTRRADIPVEHIIVVMQENRSFDNYFGGLAQAGYEGQLDGVSSSYGNSDDEGRFYSEYHETAACVPEGENDWNTAHQMFGDGTNSGFVKVNGQRAMGHYDAQDLPYYYALANRFAVADRYFSSVMTETYPNRMFLLAGTSFGHVSNDLPKFCPTEKQATIFDLLDRYKISWKFYNTDVPASLLFPRAFFRDLKHLAPAAQFAHDAKHGTLPEVVFLESSQLIGTEYSSFDYHVGNAAMAKKINALIRGKSWATSALFLTFDEAGGLYDHVPPPEACVPDSNAPLLKADDVPGTFDRYGFRVPFLLVSPWAKRHHVSHVVYDHTSILRFIETKFNLPALTRRDANADPMFDLFDFGHPTSRYRSFRNQRSTSARCSTASRTFVRLPDVRA